MGLSVTRRSPIQELAAVSPTRPEAPPFRGRGHRAAAKETPTPGLVDREVHAVQQQGGEGTLESFLSHEVPGRVFGSAHQCPVTGSNGDRRSGAGRARGSVRLVSRVAGPG